MNKSMMHQDSALLQVAGSPDEANAAVNRPLMEDILSIRRIIMPHVVRPAENSLR
jgi:hypothetical protein